MTRLAKKEHERRLARRFLDGFISHSSLEEGEKPDFRVRRPEGDFGLEVTEYHSLAEEGADGRPRVAVEASWWRQLEPIVNSERRSKGLNHIHAHLRFAGGQLPGRAKVVAVARELVGAVEAAVADRRFDGREAVVEFAPRIQIESFGDFQDGTVFLPTESWPEVSRRLESLIVSRDFAEWRAWDCQNATTAWLGPDKDEFKRILDGKAQAARDYTLDGLDLWLLVVCDAVDDGGEAHGDLASHIFPGNEWERDQLAAVLSRTGFDFEGGPFTEVWLFSAMTGDRHRLYPS